jgi:hypothetical protein
MSGSVSVPGPNGSTVTQTFSNSFNSQLAQSISKALLDAQAAGTLTVTSATSSGLVPSPVSGLPSNNELFVSLPPNGSVTVPAGYGYVVDNSPGPDTIFGSPGQQILVGSGQHTIIDPTSVVLSDNAIGVVTLTGAGDTVAAGNGAATVNARAANEAVLGGGGALFSNLSGSGDTLIGGTGGVSATVSGNGSEVAGSTVFGAGGLSASVSGTSDTILAGSGSAAVTLTSSASKGLVVGTSAALSVLDSGTSDTITAGLSFTTITAPGGAFVHGGSGPLIFIGGGPSTIVGASGASTVFGSTALTSIIGGAGGAFTYVNTTSGGLAYQAGSGNETVDASLSKGSVTLGGGSDPTGQNLLIGGAGNDFINAGRGAESLFGGGGSNVFGFFSANGGPAVNDVIGDLSAVDTVFLVGYGSGAATNAIAGATTTASSTTITLSDNTKITFSGVTNSAALTGHLFSS